jgi:hypothetical protein
MSSDNSNIYQPYRFYLCDKSVGEKMLCERLPEPYCFWTGDEGPHVFGIHKMIPEQLDNTLLYLKWTHNTAVSWAKKLAEGVKQ